MNGETEPGMKGSGAACMQICRRMTAKTVQIFIDKPEENAVRNSVLRSAAADLPLMHCSPCNVYRSIRVQEGNRKTSRWKETRSFKFGV